MTKHPLSKKAFKIDPYIIIVLGALYLMGRSFIVLNSIRHPDRYCVMFGDLPDALLSVRYVISLFSRILMIILAIGLILRQEKARRWMVVLAWYNLLTIYWRHPYSAFENISRYLGLNSEDFLRTLTIWGHSFYPGVLSRMLFIYAKDIVIYCLVIFILSHPETKKIFQRPKRVWSKTEKVP